MAEKSTTGGETIDSPVDRLSVAIKEGNGEEFLRLLRTEVGNLHGALDKHGLNPLHVAVQARRHKMVCTLLHHQKHLRLDVNIMSRNPRMMGWTALHFAVQSNNSRVAKMLLKHGCDVRSLIEAVTTGSLRSWEKQCKDSLTSWGKQCKLNDFVRIQELAHPNLVPRAHLENPQSLTALDIGNMLPDLRLGLLIEALLHLEAIIPYRPCGSFDVRYCFPSHFPLVLPTDAWQDPHKYTINVGRYLAPISGSMNLQEVLFQLLARVLADIGECEYVSQHSFCFKTKFAECKVECRSGEDGIMVLVRTNESFHISVPHCCDILSYIIEATQEVANGCLSCSVVSSHDLQEERLSPHIYSASEVRHARVTQQRVLVHPSGIKERFLNLLLEGMPSEETPTKQDGYVVSLRQLSNPIGGYTPPRQKLHVVRQLQHPITECCWSVSVCEEAIRLCYKDLTKYMKPNLLIPSLVEARYLTPEEASSVITQSGPFEQSVRLLGLLQRNLKGPKDYHDFFRILREEEDHCSHRELAESLIKTCEEIASSDQEESFTEQPWIPESPGSYNDRGYRTEADGSYDSRGRHIRTSSSYSGKGSYRERTCSTSADSGVHTQSNNNSRKQYHRLTFVPKTTSFGKTNASAGNFAGANYKQGMVFSPLTVKVPSKQPVEVNTQQATPPQLNHIQNQEPHDYLPGQAHLSLQHISTEDDELFNTKFEMKELFHPATCPLLPLPDIDEEGELISSPHDTSPLAKDSAKPIAVPRSSSPTLDTTKSIPLPTSRRSSEQSDSSTGSSPDSCASSYWSLEASCESSTSPPKDLSCYEESWKSKAKTVMKGFFQNFFSPVERPQYVVGLGIRM